jgi:hypothetical protein
MFEELRCVPCLVFRVPRCWSKGLLRNKFVRSKNLTDAIHHPTFILIKAKGMQNGVVTR